LDLLAKRQRIAARRAELLEMLATLLDRLGIAVER